MTGSKSSLVTCEDQKGGGFGRAGRLDGPARARVTAELGEDGQSFPITLDFDRNRVNFTVEKGKVVEVGSY